MDRPCAAAGRSRWFSPVLVRGAFFAGALLPLPPADATVIVIADGTSAAGRAVRFTAAMTVSGDDLFLALSNVSPEPSRAAADVLTSFYFDVVRSDVRPPLELVEAAGYVVRVRAGLPDEPEYYTPQTYVNASGRLSDLVARVPGDASWLGRAMNQDAPPFAGFGVGTVGNSGLSPNSFNPHIVGPPGRHMIDFAIATDGDLDPVGVLDGAHLVRRDASFRFTGASGFSESDIVDRYSFGLGTGPDSVITISMPEPSGLAIAAAGVALLAGSIVRSSPRLRVTPWGRLLVGRRGPRAERSARPFHS